MFLAPFDQKGNGDVSTYFLYLDDAQSIISDESVIERTQEFNNEITIQNENPF